MSHHKLEIAIEMERQLTQELAPTTEAAALAVAHCVERGITNKENDVSCDLVQGIQATRKFKLEPPIPQLRSSAATK